MAESGLPYFDFDFGGDRSGGGGGGGMPGVGGQNQWFSGMPQMPAGNTPGVVPPSSAGSFSAGGNLTGLSPYTTNLGSTMKTVSPIDPGLTTQLFNYLQSQIGRGATPFNLSTALPGGGVTGPGQLSAPENPFLSKLQDFLTPGKVPEAWGAIIDAMQRSIGEGRAQLKEGFNFAGGLASSPFGTASADFESQTAKDKNAMLLQMVQQMVPFQFETGKLLQGMDQSAIDRMMQEFIRTQPEYSPLLNLQFGAGTTFPPMVPNQAGLGGLGGILQSLPQLLALLVGGGG